MNAFAVESLKFCIFNTFAKTLKNVSGYACNHGFLRIGNATLHPLEGARGTPSACPVSVA